MILLSENRQILLREPKVIYRRGKKELVVIDTETCNDDKLIFDYCMTRIDLSTGRELERTCIVVCDTYKTKKIIMGKYSKVKRKKYPPLLKSGEYQILTREELKDFINDYCKRNKNIVAFGAFNVCFDLQALYNTYTYTNPRMKYFKKPLINELSDLKIFNYDICDIWANAVVIFGSKEYKQWYKKNNYPLTKGGYMHTNVQYLKKFLTYKGLYNEKHIAKYDVSDELNIMLIVAIMRYDRKLLLNVSGKQMLAMATLHDIPKGSKLYDDLVRFKKFMPDKLKKVNYQK